MGKEKNLELERLVFFSDAVVAIAITLLALDLRLEKGDISSHLSFADIGHLWPKFSAFILSFVLIAVFWKIHHQFYYFIRKIDNRLLWYNVWWLLFIIILPFSTTLISSYYGQTVSVFVYSVNTLLITLFQNNIWDHVALRPDYLNDRATAEVVYNYRVDCNVAMVNAILASVLSFINPVAALIVLFTRPVMIRYVKRLFKYKHAKRAKAADAAVSSRPDHPE